MKILSFFLITLFFSCSSSNYNEQISGLLPKEFNLSLHQENYKVPTKVKIYTFEKDIQNAAILTGFPIESKEEGWSFKKWHMVNDRRELGYLLAMLDLSQYPMRVNNQQNNYTDLISSIKETMTNKESYVSYYFRKKDSLDFYKNGYIEFFCLQPSRKRIIYLSFGDF